MLRDADSNATFGIGKILKYKPHDLSESSEAYNARRLEAAKKTRYEYKQSALHQRLSRTMKKVKEMQQQNLSIQDSFNMLALKSN